MGTPRSVDQMRSPVAASSARKAPSVAPAHTIPPVTTGDDANERDADW